MEIKEFLAYLQCPYCGRQSLSLQKLKKKLVCKKCRSDFDLVGGVPVLMKKEHLGKQERHQRAWFEKHYSQFSREKYQLENWRQSMLKRIFSNRPANGVKTYLDLGCGATGYTAIEAARKNDWLSFGVDISLEAMLRAKALAKKQGVEKKTAFLVCSAENLPFRKNVFDYVSAISILEHLENDRAVIKSVSQIIKKNGLFYICVPNTYRRIWPFLWPIYFYLDKKIGHRRHYSLENLSRKMSQAGFCLQKGFYNGHLVKLFQMALVKLHLINDRAWWQLEAKDISSNRFGLQLNALYKKT